MFLTEPEPTRFDLRFRMFGIAVRVSPWFWVTTLILGSNTLKEGVQFLLLWILCVFVSILVHELGHVWMGQLFGSHGHIVLYGFGGLAVGSNIVARRWQRIAVLFAGPLAGFVLLGLVLLVVLVLRPEQIAPLVELAKFWLGLPFDPQVFRGAERLQPLVEDALYSLLWINLFWGLVNLLPIWPLDGGQISREVFAYFTQQKAMRYSLLLSAIAAAALALQSLAATAGWSPLRFPSGLYSVLFFGLLAAGSWQLLQQLTRSRRQGWEEEGRREPWERDPDYWKR